mgnify:CR=1 FL=1
MRRGCSHGCICCDSRSRRYHMEHDFEDIERNCEEYLFFLSHGGLSVV